MKRYLFSLSVFCLSIPLFSQVTFLVESLPEYTPPEDVIYVAGTFNNWNPGDPAFALQKNEDDKWILTGDAAPEGTEILFKFTRGSWETVEKGPQGEEITDRSFTFGNGDTVKATIHNWADFGAPADSTAAWNVSIMHTAFYMPQLDRTRRIWIYKPPDYEESNRSYPVLYMHDGQNLFETVTSFAGEWEVDETLNQLADSGYQVPIVIGIDNGGFYRTEELTPWVHPEYPTGRGDDYMAFIVETLKPYVDSSYRTLKDRNNTGIMGSSLGGLISTYGALKYQEVFSKSGPFSPAYWINYDSIWGFMQGQGKQHEISFYQNMGDQEGEVNILIMQQLEDSLKAMGFERVNSKVIPNAGHNEATGREDFRNAYLWLFPSFANSIFEREAPEMLTVVPNPVVDVLSFENLEISRSMDLKVYDLTGRLVRHCTIANNVFRVDSLPPGHYVVYLKSDEQAYVAKFIKK
jgi:predicted alpha/beta superfamily hydrolase